MSNNQLVDDLIELRKRILNEIRAEMIGPGSENIGPEIKHEIISDSPVSRYSTGILYPQGTVHKREDEEPIDTDIDEDQSQQLETEDMKTDLGERPKQNEKHYINNYGEETESEIDAQMSMANQLLPSSMGFTFFAKGNFSELNVNVKCAHYIIANFEDCCVNYIDSDADLINTSEISEFLSYNEGKLKLKRVAGYNDINALEETGIYSKLPGLKSALIKLINQCTNEKNKKYAYKRVPLSIENPISVEAGQGGFESIEVIPESGLELSVFIRSYNDIRSITVMLVNANEKQSSEKVNICNTYFQVELAVRTADNNELTFTDYINSPYINPDLEEQSLELLYRDKKTYATGHGVSAVYEVNDEGEGYIETDYMPYYEVPKLNFDINEIKEISDKVLSMKNLSDISRYSLNEKIDLLNKFVNAYKSWIEGLKEELESIDYKYRELGLKHVNQCYTAHDRMLKGISFIAENKKINDAFALTNRAMLMQRIHSEIQSKERFPDEGTIEKSDYRRVDEQKAKWRPFQLAFILMSIDSIATPDSAYRDTVDLIWFPTGGGKTEAYLGITAFTIFLRRFSNNETGGGTAVIMRYTLRLLAAQQFIRASILICACEVIRREGLYELGKEQITIGLWIGGEHTPNSNAEAKKCMQELSKANTEDLGYRKNKYNKFQLLKCPWCGTKLTQEVVGNKINGQWGYRCKANNVTILCTEQQCEFDGYLPVQVVDEEIYKNPPTLLFGTVDKFAMMTWREEVSKLFATDHGNINKSPELIIQDELHLISGPLGTMVGLYETAIDAMCSSKGIKPKIIASTATIRRAGEQCLNLYNRDVKQFPPPGLLAEDSFFAREIPVSKEPGRLYVGIMSSGKTKATLQIRLMATMLQKLHLLEVCDEQKDKYWTLVTYFNSLRDLGKSSTLVDDDVKDSMIRLADRLDSRLNTRLIYAADELTSRVPSGRIIKILENLEVEYSKENIEDKRYPINVLLASNMISVGVDVSRLNLMLIVGQPKLTSEYIQASSRIGRKYPGLVFTMFDGTKSRDRSHYEQFYSYHQSFYKYVEPTSVTPFSAPARERALHALLITMVRHILKLNSEEMATAFERDNEDIKSIETYILKRVSEIDAAEVNDTKKEIEEFWKEWDEKIFSLPEGEMLTYTKEDKRHLIKPFGSRSNDYSKPTLQSMRNVDSQSAVNILIFGDEKNERS